MLFARHILQSTGRSIAVSTWVLWVFGCGFAHGQLLKKKTRSDLDAAAPGDTVQATASDLPGQDGESQLAPFWERRYFATMDEIDDAIAAYETAIAELADAQKLNPIVSKEQRSEAVRRYLRSIPDHDLVVFFRLEGIREVKAYSRNRHAYSLTLSDPTFPANRYSGDVTVVISPAQAKELQLGSILRAEGRLTVPPRDSIGTIVFSRQSGLAPVDGKDQQRISKAVRQSALKDDAYAFAYHISEVRELKGGLAEEYQAFLARYRTKIVGYQSATP